ncbi:MAG: DoxX family membrane protein [Anaerolineaceae bacterium]|nr:DoxX family membrane protein [Anaerolineaceae bacterium]
MKKWLASAEPKTPLFWVSLLRIMMGLLFLTTWFSNLNKGFYTPDGILAFFTDNFPQAENPLTWYAGFIEGVILPIRSIFAPFQLIAELTLGIALLTGTFTRLFSLAGLFFLLNTFLGTFGHDWPWAYIMPIAIHAVLFFTNAGRSMGLDAVLKKRFGERHFLFW